MFENVTLVKLIDTDLFASVTISMRIDPKMMREKIHQIHVQQVSSSKYVTPKIHTVKSTHKYNPNILHPNYT